MGPWAEHLDPNPGFFPQIIDCRLVLEWLAMDVLEDINCKQRTYTHAGFSMQVTFREFWNCTYPEHPCHADLKFPRGKSYRVD
jgi:hypothetical protein